MATYHSDMSAARAAINRPGGKPEGNVNRIERLKRTRECIDYYMEGHSVQWIANKTGYCYPSVKRYLDSIEDIVKDRLKRTLDEKITKTVMNLRHYQAKMETAKDADTVKASAVGADIEMKIAQVEGYLDKNEQQGMTQIKVIVEREKEAQP